jgi:hypothetical protein
MEIVESEVGFTEQILGRICSGAITVASAIMPGFSKNWEWDIDDLGPLVPVQLGSDAPSNWTPLLTFYA